jgi:single-strand selective monofunctional uracil DNA glycosylase
LKKKQTAGQAERILAITDQLRQAVNRLTFADPVAWVYNPLDYAWDLHAAYVRTWGASRRRVLLMGMNPGPWGMVQTGVPFGEVAAVRDFLRLQGTVGHPVPEHPGRPVAGLDCRRSEVSGRRLWGFFAREFGTAEAFFAEHFVVNYCPLVFMEDSARNRTPDKLPVAESAPLFAACDEWLRLLVEAYEPQWVVGVGGFAGQKLESLFGAKADRSGLGHCPASLGTVLHPSPASPAANRGWEQAARRQLKEQGIW